MVEVRSVQTFKGSERCNTRNSELLKLRIHEGESPSAQYAENIFAKTSRLVHIRRAYDVQVGFALRNLLKAKFAITKKGLSDKKTCKIKRKSNTLNLSREGLATHESETKKKTNSLYPICTGIFFNFVKQESKLRK